MKTLTYVLFLLTVLINVGFCDDASFEKNISVENPAGIGEEENTTTKDLLGLGKKYFYGKGVDQNTTKAFELISQSAMEGDPNSLYDIGLMLYYGSGTDQNVSSAIERFKAAAIQNEPLSMVMLAKIYESGDGVEENNQEALSWYKRSAENGNVESMQKVATFYYDGKGVDQNYTKAFKWYSEILKHKNDPDVANNIGLMYLMGSGVEPDINKAKTFFLEAAKNGSAEALYNLGGVSEQSEEYRNALLCYTKAINKKFYAAYDRIGVLYENGLGVKEDHRVAAKWYFVAASKGDADGVRNLGRIFENGVIIERNFVLSLALYEYCAKIEEYENASTLVAIERVGKHLGKKNTQGASFVVEHFELDGISVVLKKYLVQFNNPNKDNKQSSSISMRKVQTK